MFYYKMKNLKMQYGYYLILRNYEVYRGLKKFLKTKIRLPMHHSGYDHGLNQPRGYIYSTSVTDIFCIIFGFFCKIYLERSNRKSFGEEVWKLKMEMFEFLMLN